MKILVRAVGKMRDRRLASLCEEYAERVRRHVPMAVEEVEDEKGLLLGLPAGTEIVALEPGGEAWSTAEFTRYVERGMVQGRRAVAFLIGGAEGLAAVTVERAQRRLSLSPLTLPHRLARVLLCEQIYRAVSIIRGEPYSK
ncbi:MAG: 23S rRNA (pseudouridine(1915)-N(3))-methyltransferase RlmH [Deltaproteobacteria bacterium]|nr:23S rRNA (pseudouridine(1915)-N(3))-methyltransferase RlmH [Deltaproteobacteria bacterium]